MSSVEPEIRAIENYRWLPNDVYQLIELVKENPAIYNPQDKNYFCRPFVENIWREIDLKLKKNPGCSLAKWTNLRICFRREYATLLSENVRPSWKYFVSMFFLHRYLRKKRSNPENLENHIQEALEQISSITRGNIKNFVRHIESIESCDEPESVADDSHSAEGSGDDDDCVIDESLIIKEETAEENSHSSNCNDEEIELTFDSANNISNNSLNDVEQISHYDHKKVEIKKRNLKRKRQTNEQHTNETHFQGFAMTTSKNSARGHTEYLEQQNTKEEDKNKKSTEKRNKCFEYPYIQTETKPSKQINQVINASIDSNEINSDKITSKSSNKLCDCKTDPDAMFLMSLLPDIQSLSRRDKGKFKIEIQKLIQDLLYPDLKETH